MTRYTPTHRSDAATRTPMLGMARKSLTVGAGGALAVTGLGAAFASTASAAPTSAWDKVAACESSGNWSINTGMFDGGLQFLDSTWDGYGGEQYAPTADQATKAQQIAIAEKVLAGQGWTAWPNCGGPVSGYSGDSDAAAATSSSSGSSDSSEQESSSNEDSSNEESSSSESSQQSSQPAEPQGDWSCDGDGISGNCDENGFTIESVSDEQDEDAEEQSEPAEERESEEQAEPAEETSESASSVAASGDEYTVDSGDTLYSLGVEWGVDFHDIADLNDIDNVNLIYAGNTLEIPAA